MAISALTLLTSEPLSEVVPEEVDDVVITSLPLLFVHRHGNKLAEGVAGVLCDRMQRHPLLGGLKELIEDEGELRVNGG